MEKAAKEFAKQEKDHQERVKKEQVGDAYASCCTLRPRASPFPEENSTVGVVYESLL